MILVASGISNKYFNNISNKKEKIKKIECYSGVKDRVYGTIVHAILEKYVNEDNELDKQEALKDGFDRLKKYKLLRYARRFYNAISNYNEKQIIKNYFKEDFKVLGKEIPLQDIHKDITIKGSIDKLLTNKKEDKLIILDYKNTLKLKSINNFRGQGITYDYLIRKNIKEFKESFYKEVYFIINFIDFKELRITKLTNEYKNFSSILNG